LIDCFGVCVNLQTDPNHCGYCGEVCPSGQCDTGLCFEVVGPAPGFIECPPGQANCGGGCIDVSVDEANCGGCGNVCDAVQQCILGRCEFACPSGQADCGAGCIDVTADPANCGGCGNVCAGDQQCIFTRCE
jgi:hypothetical protein